MLGIVLGLAGAVGAAVIGAWAVLRARRPPKSHVELVSVTIGPRRGDLSPMLDVKVRNTGGQPAVLKRAIVHVHQAVRCGTMSGSMELTPYREKQIRTVLPVSDTYDVSIRPPEEAVGAAVGTGISQVVAPGEADRFEVRLGMTPTYDTYAYRVSLEVIYDEDDRSVTSAPVAVAFPEHPFVHRVGDIRNQVREFLDDVAEIRAAIDREMTARGLSAPDWVSAPPRGHAELPGGLVAVDGMAHPFGSSIRDGFIEITDAFWHPERSVALHVREFGRMYGELGKIVKGAADVDGVLCAEVPRAQATLTTLTGLYAEFPLLPEPPAKENPKAKAPARLMRDLFDGKTDQGREQAAAQLSRRMRSGDEATLWFLGQIVAEPNRLRDWMTINGITSIPKAYPAAELLDEFLHAQRPDDTEAFRIRRTIAQKRAAKDPAGAAAILRRVLSDQVRALGSEHQDTCDTRLYLYKWLQKAGDMAAAAAVLSDVVADQERTRGPDHESTLGYRHDLAFCLGESGDKAGAVEAFRQLYAADQRVLGPDHPDTLDVRHELARWLGEAGDPAAAATAFAELVPERIRIQGPDHPHTLFSRHNLARWRGEAGDPAAAAAEFQEVLADRERVLGPDHPETKNSREALEHWRERAQRRGHFMG